MRRSVVQQWFYSIVEALIAMMSRSLNVCCLQGRHNRLWLLAWLGFLLFLVPAVTVPTPAAAGPPDQKTTPDYRKGVLYGKVIDAVTGKPVAGATVALQDKKGKVIAWSQTNAQGEYAIAADPMTVLDLRPSRGRGLLEEVCRSVGNAVMAPVKMVANVVVNPGPTLNSMAVSVASGTPAPVAAQIAAPVLTSPKQAGGIAAQTALQGKPKEKKDEQNCGDAPIVVTAPNYKDVQGKASAYWMEPPGTEDGHPCGLQTWISTVKLAPVSAGDKKSEIEQEALTLADPQVSPVLAPAGSTVQISVKLQDPSSVSHAVRVFAREMRKDVVVELMPGTGANSNVFTGKMTLDPKTPAGETAITIAALRADPVEVKWDKKKPDPLAEYVRRLDDMQAAKPYEYDPRIMASANRLDVKVTILSPKQGTPTAATAPAAPGSNPPGKK